MKRTNTQPINKIIDLVLKELNIDSKVKETRVIALWEETLGKGVARATQSLYIKNRILFVALKSSVVRNELYMMRSTIVNALNERAGGKIIDDIVLR